MVKKWLLKLAKAVLYLFLIYFVTGMFLTMSMLFWPDPQPSPDKQPLLVAMNCGFGLVRPGEIDRRRCWFRSDDTGVEQDSPQFAFFDNSIVTIDDENELVIVSTAGNVRRMPLSRILPKRLSSASGHHTRTNEMFGIRNGVLWNFETAKGTGALILDMKSLAVHEIPGAIRACAVKGSTDYAYEDMHHTITVISGDKPVFRYRPSPGYNDWCFYALSHKLFFHYCSLVDDHVHVVSTVSQATYDFAFFVHPAMSCPYRIDVVPESHRLLICASTDRKSDEADYAVEYTQSGRLLGLRAKGMFYGGSLWPLDAQEAGIIRQLDLGKS